jgi:uncharacterized membrane protein
VLRAGVRIIDKGAGVSKGRLEAFSDGVFAIITIIITIMVLELRVPHGSDWAALQPLIPVFLAYVLSFVYVGIYWNNHHHMLQLTDQINGSILWANLHLLFWLSLVPFITGWMGENHFESLPTAIYGVVLIANSVAYLILQGTIISSQGKNSRLAAAVKGDIKGRISTVLYALAIPLAFKNEWIADSLYVTVALIWLVPDRRIERTLKAETGETGR